MTVNIGLNRDGLEVSDRGNSGDIMEKINSEWVRCPVYGNKTRTMISKNTELINFPLYCPKYKQETLINAQNVKISLLDGKS